MSLDDRINDACHRIEELYNETDGHCYVSFSGGKDSTVLLSLIKMCEELYTIPKGGIPAVFSNTGIEMGVTVDFVKWVKENYYPNVITIRPEKSFDWVLKSKGKPFRSKMRSEFIDRWQRGNRSESVYRNLILGMSKSGIIAFRTKLSDKDILAVSDEFPIKVSNACCLEMKKRPMAKYEKENDVIGVALGIRSDEGGARALRTKPRQVTGERVCTEIVGGKIKKSPIIDWTESDVDEFVKTHHVPLSEAYTKYGFDRTGCMCCPFSKYISHTLKYLYDHEPNRYKASMHWLKDVYIAQNVILPFDEEYERERERMWFEVYEPMRQEMLRKYRPNSRLIKDHEQTNIFNFLEEDVCTL